MLVTDILTCEKNLSNGVVVFGEELVVCVHQLTLTYCCSCLFFGEKRRTFSELELAHSHTDSTGRNENHLVTCIFDIGENFAKLLHVTDVQTSCFVSKSRCSDFNNDAHLYKILRGHISGNFCVFIIIIHDSA